MKTSVISDDFRARYLSDPDDPDAFEGRVVVFDGPEDYHARIDDPSLGIDERTLLVMRGTGPRGYPGGAEVVNMRPPAALIRAGVDALPCIGDGRQSGTSGSPSILNASPEAAVGGGLALLRTGDRVRVDLRRREVNMLVDDEEIARRRAELDDGYGEPASQTPWQEIHRNLTGQFDTGAVLESAVKFQRIAQTHGLPATVIDARSGSSSGRGATCWAKVRCGPRARTRCSGSTSWRTAESPVAAEIAIDEWAMPEMIGWLIERSRRAGLHCRAAERIRRSRSIRCDRCDRGSRARTPANRLNDAEADARSYLGGLHVDGRIARRWALYRLDPDRIVDAGGRGYRIANGPAMSPDGQWLYHTDSAAGASFDSAGRDGSLGERGTFIEFETLGHARWHDGRSRGRTVGRALGRCPRQPFSRRTANGIAASRCPRRRSPAARSPVPSSNGCS